MKYDLIIIYAGTGIPDGDLSPRVTGMGKKCPPQAFVGIPAGKFFRGGDGDGEPKPDGEFPVAISCTPVRYCARRCPRPPAVRPRSPPMRSPAAPRRSPISSRSAPALRLVVRRRSSRTPARPSRRLEAKTVPFPVSVVSKYPPPSPVSVIWASCRRLVPRKNIKCPNSWGEIEPRLRCNPSCAHRDGNGYPKPDRFLPH
jgi:hypothetical protein